MQVNAISRNSSIQIFKSDSISFHIKIKDDTFELNTRLNDSKIYNEYVSI